MKTTAALLTEAMTTPDGKDRRDGKPNAVYGLIRDGDLVHCMTEDLLDTWWTSLPPTQKAEVHERWLDADLYSTDQVLTALRDPLPHVYAAAEKLAETDAKPFVPSGTAMPTFCPAEVAYLRLTQRRQN